MLEEIRRKKAQELVTAALKVKPRGGSFEVQYSNKRGIKNVIMHLSSGAPQNTVEALLPSWHFNKQGKFQ